MRATDRLTRREALVGGLAGLAGVAAARPERYEAVVGAPLGDARAFPSLEAALAAAPASGDRPYRVLLRAGRWDEKPTITTPNVWLFGEGRGRTVLTHAVASGHRRPDGRNWGTSGSATLTVTAPGFRAERMTVANGFDYLDDMRTGASGGAQAVALALNGGSDRAVLRDVEITGYQDTLLTHAGRALFQDCRISGSVDFIFGGGRVFFDRCEIVSRATPGRTQPGYIAAPSTPHVQPYGLVFDRCRLTREPGVADGSIYLGRPWRAGGNPELRGAATFLRCWMDAHIAGEGWTSMGFRGAGNFPLQLQPEEARFAEYESRGPGARPHARRRRLTPAEARRYVMARVLEGWSIPNV